MGSLKSQVNLATLYGESGNYNFSEILLNSALEIRPSADIYYNTGIIQQKGLRLGDAKESYEKCLGLRPGHELCQLNLGVIYEAYSKYNISMKLYSACLETTLRRRFL